MDALVYFANSSFWELQEKKNQPWTLKGLLQLRNEAHRCVDIAETGCITWKGLGEDFKTKAAYETLDMTLPKPRWYSLVWNKLSPPKHCFCSWLAIIGKLPTADKFLNRLNFLSCCWCQSSVETVEHLMFECQHMNAVQICLGRLGFAHQCNSWNNLFEQIERREWRSDIPRKIILFSINAIIYETWRNRNEKFFTGKVMTPSELVERVFKMLRLKLDLMKRKR